MRIPRSARFSHMIRTRRFGLREALSRFAGIGLSTIALDHRDNHSIIAASFLAKRRFLLFPSLVVSKNKHCSPSGNPVRQLDAVGLNRVELLTPSLSEKCSNQLSYRPNKKRMG